jgi:hypothetical protein
MDEREEASKSQSRTITVRVCSGGCKSFYA